jgi:hypothetical protein
MTSPSDMDKPAIVLTCLVGVVLIGVSLPFLIWDGNDDGTRYLITWTEATAPNGEAEDTTLTIGENRIPIRFDSIIPSNATISITCNDSATAPVQNLATVAWELERNGTVVDQGNGCPANERVALGTHPDVGSATADSSGQAEDLAEDGGEMAVEYVLVITVTRASGPAGPLPVGEPTFSGAGSLTVLEWAATANEPAEGMS